MRETGADVEEDGVAAPNLRRTEDVGRCSVGDGCALGVGDERSRQSDTARQVHCLGEELAKRRRSSLLRISRQPERRHIVSGVAPVVVVVVRF